MNEFIEWGALGQVLVAGVLVGAGIPALFALGLRLLAGTGPVPEAARADGGEPAPHTGAAVPASTPRPGPVRLAGAVLCLAIVVAAVVTGLVFVVTGGH
ncbi:hypothetical protein ACIG47_11075 [Promicromonospora sp. NPDC052451]|uniref:hypothetical protein n=1 Tax=Promicromonospora sp. NPDC052451 TaxID=3364407 RepID=UPI0037C5E014